MVYCGHDAETEVLTGRGWVRWPDYDGACPLATMDRRTGYLEFQVPLEYQRRVHDGPMAFAIHNRLDFGLTLEHRIFHRPYRIPKPYVPGGAGYGPSVFGPVGDLPTRCLIPGATTGFVGTELEKLGVGARTWGGTDFLRLLALILSDGWVDGGEHHRNRVSFCCFRDDRREMVASFAHRVGIEETGRRGVWMLYDEDLGDWIRANAFAGDDYRSPSKRIPDLVKVASRSQIDEFLRFFGDQTIRAGGERHFYSSSKRMADDIQELLLRVGKRGRLLDRGIRSGGLNSRGQRIQGRGPSYEVHEAQESDISLTRAARSRSIEIGHYRGEVFCATVPNSTLITRRDGRILISGSS